MAKRRRDEYPERQALREMTNGYLKENPVKNGTDFNALILLSWREVWTEKWMRNRLLKV
ncbi:hypothetical protein GCM10023142_01600 [Anaerocolumna aminovalerica]|uniref:Uncharacterized protein n=1 Tax=Anaerocolumna aminovalerica TaxID=1527 RepID=A0A1I5BI24_9FIRM|nr:hypothetical protein [Anaerocolumna aminovalerica]MBU5331501.1 hypothetical protein [Anaerocolumna aminovalerica]SFN74310.1 hypothetical protein SAMN04489757_10119 [Anaerocolumna aminovalerica]